MVNAGRRGHEDRSKHHASKLRESLLNNAKKLFAKFREWDIDGDGLVDKEEFRNAIPKMGIPMMATIPASDIDELFDTLDVDGSGAISYKELKSLLRNKPVIKNPAMRYTMAVVDFCNSTTVQTLLYAAFVFVFQMLTETLRNPKLEFYFDTHISDTIMENHFDSSHNVFEDIRRIADIYEWGNYVLWPGLLGNMGPFEDSVGRPGEHVGQTGLSWPDGDGSFHGVGATAFTVGELVERMDQLDWSDGVYLRQARPTLTLTLSLTLTLTLTPTLTLTLNLTLAQTLTLTPTPTLTRRAWRRPSRRTATPSSSRGAAYPRCEPHVV